ncbi:hypothetical protein H0H92_001111, partial [Tricholoma furcatifolium]
VTIPPPITNEPPTANMPEDVVELLAPQNLEHNAIIGPATSDPLLPNPVLSGDESSTNLDTDMPLINVFVKHEQHVTPVPFDVQVGFDFLDTMSFESITDHPGALFSHSHELESFAMSN